MLEFASETLTTIKYGKQDSIERRHETLVHVDTGLIQIAENFQNLGTAVEGLLQQTLSLVKPRELFF